MKFKITLNIFYIILISFFLSISFSKSENNLWNFSNGNFTGHKYSELNQININNVSQLKLAWTHNNNGHIPKDKTNNQITPIFTGESLILSTVDGFVISLNPDNGKEKWRLKLQTPVAKRGLFYFEKSKTIFTPTGKGIVAIYSFTGKIQKQIGKKGYFGNSISLLSPIIVDQDIFISFLDKIESFSINEGNKNWSINLNGARVWSGFSYDDKTETLAVVTSNLINMWGKTDVKPDFSNSLILINPKDGSIRCKFKDVIHDHWDLDMQGSPIFTDVDIGNKTKKAVYAFSKTGNILAIDVENCKFLFDDKKNFSILDTETSSYDQTYSNKQTKILLPEPLLDQKYDLNEYLKTIKDKEEADYIKFISRNSKFNKDFIPLSLNYDVIMFGLHGGPSWSGGTLDKKNNQIIIQSNHYPWILRSFYYDRLLNKLIKLNQKFFSIFSSTNYLSPWQSKTSNVTENLIKKSYSYLPHLINFKGANLYTTKCQSCHGQNRQGKYDTESDGAVYIPNLVGVTFTNKSNSLKNINTFNYAHTYEKKFNKISKEELIIIKNYFEEHDKILKKFNLLKEYGRWQLFLDKNNLPASSPPWGKINAIDKNTGKINWSIPSGYRQLNNIKIDGDINFGGLLSTGGNLLFATGTPDKFLRAYNSKTGEKLWEFKLPLAGSSSPMTYNYNGNQYIVVNASGGRQFGFENELGDTIIAFKIN